MSGVKEDRLGEMASLRRLPENPVRCMCAQSLSRVWLSETPWTVGFSVHEDSPNKNTGGVVISSPRESSQPRDRTSVSRVSCIVRWILCHKHHLGSPFQRAATSEVQPLAFASFSLPESLSLGRGCMCWGWRGQRRSGWHAPMVPSDWASLGVHVSFC